MKVLIIEDEIPAAKQLSKLLSASAPEANILEVIDSVKNAVHWLKNAEAFPDLIFMDIQLADGISFDIFSEVRVSVPVIFTTAFDNYTLKAFKVNSIDYLLKPIDPEELEQAINKFRLFYRAPYAIDYNPIMKQLKLQEPSYKQRFLIKGGQELRFIASEDIQYFFSEEGLVFAQMNTQKKYNIDYTLEQLEELLNPNFFFRINRKVILQLCAIEKIQTYFNGRLKLQLKPMTSFDIVVSRDRVSRFKSWLDR